MGKVGKLIAGIVLIAGGAVVGFATGNWTLAKIMITSGASMALSTVNRPHGLADRQGAILENHASAQDPLPVVYGTARVGNILGDVRVHTGSTERKRLVVVSAFCHGSRDGGDIAGIDDIWFDDRKAINAAGVVQAPFNTLVPNQGGIKHLEFAHHLGSTGQAVDARLTALFPAQWPAAAQGRGVAYTRFELWFNNDIFASGIPRVTALIRGNRVFDPRDATWKFSDNPALCGRDYLLSGIYGFNVPAANIDEQSVIDGANYCDELVSIPGGGTQKRFTLNGWVDTGRTIQENLADLGTACRGQWINEGDKWRLAIRRQQAVSGFKISEKNTLEGSWSFMLPGTSDAPNVIRVHYVDPARDAQPELVQWPEPGAANPYLVEDNVYESRLDLELPYTDNRLRAQQIGMTLLKEGREGIAVICTLMESALAVRTNEIVEVSHPTPGWVDKPFWVAALLLAPDASVQAVLIEYEPTVYDYDAQVAQPAYPNTGLPDPFTCAPPTALVLDSSNAQALLLKDGTYVGRIKVTWTKADDPFIDKYDIQAKRNTDADWDSFDPVRGEEPALVFVYPVTEELWNVRVSAVNQLGIRSTWLSGNTTVTVPNPTVEDADILILPTGQVNVVVRTRNAGSVKVAAKVDGTDPTDVEIRAAGPVNTGVDGVATVNAVGTVAPNGTVKIGVFAYENVAAGGRESAPSFHKTRVWDQVAGALINAHQVPIAGKRVGIAIEAVGYLSVKWALAVGGPYGAPGTGTTVNLDADFTALIDTAQVLTFLQQAFITITPYTGAGATGTQGGAIHLRARPIVGDDQYDETTGKRRRQGLFDDGLYPLKASDPAGDTANSTVKESGGKLVNRLLAKTLAGDPDTLDGTPEGTTFKRVLETAVNAGKIDLAKQGIIGSSVRFQSGTVNAGFELGNAEGWDSGGSIAGTVTNIGANAHRGSFVMLVPCGAGGPNHFSNRFPISAGERVLLQAWARPSTTSAPTTDQTLAVRWFDAAGTQVGGGRVTVGPPADRLVASWQSIRGAATAPATCVEFVIDLGEGPGTGDFWWDDVTFSIIPKDAADVLRVGGGASLQVIVQQLTDVGHAAIGMQESGGKAINRLYAKTLPADADTIDSVVDGSTYAKILGNRLTTGAIKRAGALDDGKYAVVAASTDGKAIDRAAQIDGQVRRLYNALTHLLPNSEFEVWESASQPHAWAVDTTAGAAAAKETVAADIFSGDFALKYTDPDNATAGGWHGISTNDPVKGAFCIPVRAGISYHLRIASKVSVLGSGQAYRVRWSFDAAETLTLSKAWTHKVVNAYQVDILSFTVPAGAEANAKLYIEFNRNGSAASTVFRVDSLRLEEVAEPIFFDNGNVTGTFTIDWAKAPTQRARATGNVTFRFINGRPGARYVLDYVQDATGGRTITWPGTVTFDADTPVAPATGADKATTYAFELVGDLVSKYRAKVHTNDVLMHDVKTYVGWFDVTSAMTATTTIPVTGVGFTPKLVLFYWNGRTNAADANGRTSTRRGFGAASGTAARGAVSGFNVDVSADNQRVLRNDACVVEIDGSAVTGRVDLNSFDADGFTAIVDDQFANTHRIFFLAIGGSTVAAKVGQFSIAPGTGSLAVTGVGFKPTGLMVFGANILTTEVNNFQVLDGFHLGFASSSAARYSYAGAAQGTASHANSYGNAAECESTMHSSGSAFTFSGRADLTQFDADGFTLNRLDTTGTSRDYFYIALIGVKAQVTTITTQTDTVTDIVVTGLQVQPKALIVLSHGRAQSTQGVVDADDVWSLGMVSESPVGGPPKQLSMATVLKDGAGLEAGSGIAYNAAYLHLDTAAAIAGRMLVTSLGEDGFRARMDDADPAGAMVGVLALGV